ncbi:hypothetical protein POUND7_008871 [Theobroma cacao]
MTLENGSLILVKQGAEAVWAKSYTFSTYNALFNVSQRNTGTQLRIQSSLSNA